MAGTNPWSPTQLKNASHDVLISIDEWIVWDSDRRDFPETRWTVGRPLLEQDFTLLDAAVAGELLSLFHNHADTIRIACVAQTINVIAPIRTAPGGRLWKQYRSEEADVVYRQCRQYRSGSRICGPC